MVSNPKIDLADERDKPVAEVPSIRGRLESPLRETVEPNPYHAQDLFIWALPCSYEDFKPRTVQGAAALVVP